MRRQCKLVAELKAGCDDRGYRMEAGDDIDALRLKLVRYRGPLNEPLAFIALRSVADAIRQPSPATCI